MFYAIEYAYGSNVVNNGARADRVYSFTSRKERDTFVSNGNAYVGPGERKSISQPTASQRANAEPYTKDR